MQVMSKNHIKWTK